MTAPQPKITVVLEFDHPIPAGHMEVDAAIICCIDPRWWNKVGGGFVSAMQTFADKKGWTFVPLTIAGGIKVLASEDSADVPKREALFERVEQEIELHHPKVLAFSVHRDCGAYGYAKAFGNDPERENAQLYGDLWKARNLLEAKFGSRAKIEFYIFDSRRVEQVSF